MPYTPHTQSDVKKMLETIGIESESELFDYIPKELLAKSFDLPEGQSEFEVFEYFKNLGSKNSTDKVSFLGGGYYDHIIPAAVDALAMRSEFYTAYTPYQAEASQGTLQALYEYQSLICRLCDMEATNASMYDGGTAMAEAALMAVRITRRNKILVDSGVNPIYKNIVQTYLAYRDVEVVFVDLQDDRINTKHILEHIDENLGGYIFQNPNFFGSIEDYTSLVENLHEKGALAIASMYPVSLGILKSPGELHADIYCADGQSLGNYLGFGGPSFGILASKEKYTRNLPGRIVGITEDANAKRSFVLTLQAREQHIRRDKATSNICSNQNLMALKASIFLSLLGKEGLVSLAEHNLANATYMKNELIACDSVHVYNQNQIFNEFVIEVPMDATLFLDKMLQKGYYAGLNLSKLYNGFENRVLISATEKRTKAQIDAFVEAIKEVCK